MTTQFDRWHERTWPGAVGNYGPSSAFRVMDYTRVPAVNTRDILLWRPDNRYSGYMTPLRHAESEGIEFQFDATRHGAKPRKSVIVDPRAVDKLILSLLQIRPGKWGRLEEEAIDGIRDEEKDAMYDENEQLKIKYRIASNMLHENGLGRKLTDALNSAGLN